MSYRLLSVEEVADYLHLGRADVERLVKRREIPWETRGGRVVFRRGEIDDWASQRILGLHDQRLAEYHQQSTRGIRKLLPLEAILPGLIQPEFIDPAMTAKTKASVLRELVALAAKTGRLFDPRDLLASLEAREALCSTGLPGGWALSHPRHPQPYLIETSFLVLGRPIQEIPFGATDGQPTDLFFLICCPDERMHLHTLARLCLMAQKTELLAQLRQAPDAASMHQCLLAAETAVLERTRASAKSPA